jgi:hypothetical protein
LISTISIYLQTESLEGAGVEMEFKEAEHSLQTHKQEINGIVKTERH